MTKVWRAKVDYGEKGNLMMDEITLDGISSGFLDETSTKYLEEWEQHSATVESNGLTYDVLPLALNSLAIHERAVPQLATCIRGDELLPIRISSDCSSKLSYRYNKGVWYAIRPTTCIELEKQSKVKYFDGPNKTIHEIKSYVFRRPDLENVSLFRIKFDTSCYYVTQSFVDSFRGAGLTGLRFIDTKCKVV